ncbi:MAG: AraC family transcriptional regulator [Proteobacteria bacterium]|nr:MAG: AraC family transcriptional regulator [Pseudomonadota bacterium]
MKTTTVPASYVRNLLSQVEAQGYDLHELMSYVGIDYHSIEGEEPISAELFSALYQRVMYIAQDEFFGMISVGKVPNGTFRMMCLAIIHSRTLGEAIDRASDFHEICRGARIKPLLIQRGRYAKVSFAALNSMDAKETEDFLNNQSPADIITSLSMWHHFMSWLIGERVSLKAAYFRFSKAQALSNTRGRFRSHVKFDQHDNVIVFPARYLEYPVVQNEKTLQAFLKTAPYQLLVMVDSEDSSLREQIVALIGRDFSIAPPSADQVAKTLNMSVSTLRRRLLEEGTSYQKIKDDCRRQSAIEYMNSPQLSIKDVAGLMGFDEPSAFFRSFKRWTNMTPGEYRQSKQYSENLQRH